MKLKIKKMPNIILASKSKVRKEILDNHNINCNVEVSNVDEEPIKESLLSEGVTPEIISKNLAELKANKVSQKFYNQLVLGADSVIDLNGELISKPENREQALNILRNNLPLLESISQKILQEEVIEGEDLKTLLAESKMPAM